MNPAWTLDVLPAGVENRILLSRGHAPSVRAAIGAAVTALVQVAAALGGVGRQEYRLTVAGSEMLVIPGLTQDGLVDLQSLHAIVDRWNPADTACGADSGCNRSADQRDTGG